MGSNLDPRQNIWESGDNIFDFYLINKTQDRPDYFFHRHFYKEHFTLKKKYCQYLIGDSEDNKNLLLHKQIFSL